MSVAFARAVADGLARHGIRVHYYSGWDRRGNGQSSAYQGAIVHHTAGAFDGGMSLLVNGRRDLSGPLCNMAGHANGDVTLVAAHPANHAGASGGRSMGPLPTTRSFNRLVWGLEIMYPGTVRMTDAQYRTAQIMSGVVSGILKRPNPEWARAHAETSITGKWDPGYANGRTYDMVAFRRGVWSALNSGGAPAPAPAPAPKKKGLPEMIERPLVKGLNEGRIVCPTGSASSLVSDSWASVSCTGGARVQLWFQKGARSDNAAPGAGKPVDWTIWNAERPWAVVPSGTEFIEYRITADGPGSLLIEQKPR